jgi:predicted TPR repeat methyltransferase
MIKQWHPDRKGDVLDLGCGTGLLGVSLGPIEGVLVGVDLSAGMLEQAGRHRVYDSFHHVNLLDALLATPASLYHVIAALDVFVYVGCLDAAIPNALRVLLPGGRFVFSCETGGTGDYALQSSYRYTHQRDYVQRLLGAAGFEDVSMKNLILRHEANQPVEGFLVVARKPVTKADKSS